jgi:Spy/CpxP family protein refolding chaperone
MRKIALMAAFAALTGATALSAQTGTTPPGARGRGGFGGRGGPGMMLDRQLLENITLTDAQRAKLEDLRKAERDQMQAQRGQGNSAFEEIRAAREKGDTAAVRELMEKQRAEMDARRDEQIAAIRGILTSDQYAQFDANVADFKKREAERGPGGRGRGPRPPTL